MTTLAYSLALGQQDTVNIWAEPVLIIYFGHQNTQLDIKVLKAKC